MRPSLPSQCLRESPGTTVMRPFTNYHYPYHHDLAPSPPPPSSSSSYITIATTIIISSSRSRSKYEHMQTRQSSTTRLLAFEHEAKHAHREPRQTDRHQRQGGRRHERAQVHSPNLRGTIRTILCIRTRTAVSSRTQINHTPRRTIKERVEIPIERK